MPLRRLWLLVRWEILTTTYATLAVVQKWTRTEAEKPVKSYLYGNYSWIGFGI